MRYYSHVRFAFYAMYRGNCRIPSMTSGTSEWQGVMHRGASDLPVRFEFTAGAPSKGTFSAPDLAAVDIPLSALRLGHVLHWELVVDTTRTVFDATESDDALPGTFKEGGKAPGTLTLHRISALTAKPYETRQILFFEWRAATGRHAPSSRILRRSIPVRFSFRDRGPKDTGRRRTLRIILRGEEWLR